MAPVPADRREIHSAAMPHQGGVIPRSSGFGRFMQILARQNCIGVDTQTILAKGVMDQLGSGHIEVEIHGSVIRHPEEPKNAQWHLEEGLVSILSFIGPSQVVPQVSRTEKDEAVTYVSI
jgi:hypothetical protein